MGKQGLNTDPKNWVSLYGDLLYKYALPRVNDSVVAEDLVQETFLSALKALDSFRGEASEKNWLFAILKNKIIDYYRKRAVEQSLMETPDSSHLDNEWFDAEGKWLENKIPKDWQVGDSPTDRKEMQKVINWCKNRLKELQQQVFILKYLEEMESVEICKVLNISTSNYWVLIHRARLQMRDCIEKNWIKN